MTDRLTASIRLHPRTRDMLENRKQGGQTYDDVILHMADEIYELTRDLRVQGYTPDQTKGMIMFRHMIKKLIDDWLPVIEPNQDYIRRFHYLIGEQAPSWLGDIDPDPWFLRWMKETYEDAQQLAHEQTEGT